LDWVRCLIHCCKIIIVIIVISWSHTVTYQRVLRVAWSVLDIWFLKLYNLTFTGLVFCYQSVCCIIFSLQGLEIQLQGWDLSIQGDFSLFQCCDFAFKTNVDIRLSLQLGF
jgi:hypothetical protein